MDSNNDDSYTTNSVLTTLETQAYTTYSSSLQPNYIATLVSTLQTTPGGGGLVAHTLTKAYDAFTYALPKLLNNSTGSTITSSVHGDQVTAAGILEDRHHQVLPVEEEAVTVVNEKLQLCKRLSAVVYDVTWEKLHSGDWKDTPMAWRDAYSVSCHLLKAILQTETVIRFKPKQKPPPPPPPTTTTTKPAHTHTVQTQTSKGLEATTHIDNTLPNNNNNNPNTITNTTKHEVLAILMDVVLESFRLLDMTLLLGSTTLSHHIHTEIPYLSTAYIYLRQQKHPALVNNNNTPSSTSNALHTLHEKQNKSGDGGTSSGTTRELLVDDVHQDFGIQLPSAINNNKAPSGSMQISTIELPSLETFLLHYMKPPQHTTGTDEQQQGGIPVVVNGAMQHWPALAKWNSVSYLRHVAGPRTVPVELGTHYLAEEWGQGLMTFNEFLDKYLLIDCPAISSASLNIDDDDDKGEQQRKRLKVDSSTTGTTNFNTAAAAAAKPVVAPSSINTAVNNGSNSKSRKTTGYLAQHDLLSQIDVLARDVCEPEYCSLGDGTVESINTWIGPAGTVTPLHTDPWHNLLCQVVGRKYIRLYPPAATPAMYPFTTGITTNSSQVDLDRPDREQYPLFEKEPYMDCVLEAGQLLYIPPGWWHYVKALTPSCSVSYWFH